MDITTTKEKDVWLVCPDGHIDFVNSSALEKTLTELLDEGAVQLLLDFSDVAFIASAGFRVLLMASQKLKAVNGTLRICCVNDTVREVFDICGFDKIIDTFDSRDQGLGSFA